MRKNEHEFEKWIKEKGIDESDNRVTLLKEAWNKSLELASEWFGINEGVDYGVWEMYHAE